MKTRRVGEQFDYKGVKLEVFGWPNLVWPCRDCYFVDKLECHSMDRFQIAGVCGGHNRNDGMDVYFKEVL